MPTINRYIRSLVLGLFFTVTANIPVLQARNVDKIDDKTYNIIDDYRKKMEKQEKEQGFNDMLPPRIKGIFMYNRDLIVLRTVSSSPLDLPEPVCLDFNSFRSISTLVGKRNDGRVSKQKLMNALEEKFKLKTLRDQGLKVSIVRLQLKSHAGDFLPLGQGHNLISDKDGLLKQTNGDFYFQYADTDTKRSKTLLFYIHIEESATSKWNRWIKRGFWATFVVIVVGIIRYIVVKRREKKKSKFQKFKDFFKKK